MLTATLAAILIYSTVFAGAIKLSGSFKLGSLVATGYATGLGNTNWVIELNGDGHAGVTCTNYGSNDVPGQSSPKVNGKATGDLFGDTLGKNGKSPFALTAKPDEELNAVIPWDEGGCPNPNWTAKIDFVYWDSANITVKDPITGDVVASQNYICVTTRIPQNDGYSFDDGTVSCTPVK